jgi:hypothetical protein
VEFLAFSSGTTQRCTKVRTVNAGSRKRELHGGIVTDARSRRPVRTGGPASPLLRGVRRRLVL